MLNSGCLIAVIHPLSESMKRQTNELNEIRAEYMTTFFKSFEIS